MKSAEPVKRRSYDSSRRRAQADETRARSCALHATCSSSSGYGRTTIADIAGAAGVSVETIYSRVRHQGHPAAQGMGHHRRRRRAGHRLPRAAGGLAIRNEPDLAKRLMLHAAFSTQTAQRIAPFQLMVQSAAGADPAAAAMLEEMGRQRLVGMTVMAAEAAKTGQLAVPEEECRDVIWSMTDGMLWHRLVNERGWTNDRFAEWLGACLGRQPRQEPAPLNSNAALAARGLTPSRPRRAPRPRTDSALRTTGASGACRCRRLGSPRGAGSSSITRHATVE